MTSSASAAGSECRGLVLKLHLQKHYLLKNYTSRDLEIVLDPNENFVELIPKDDPDALRMLRHADAQVASKYRSFLTFIRCEFLLLLPARLAASNRALAVAHKNMLAIENPSTAQKKQYASLLINGAQLCLVTGTLARAKSFLGELYRPGESSNGSTSVGTSPGPSDDARPVLENSSSEGSIHGRRSRLSHHQHRNSLQNPNTTNVVGSATGSPHHHRSLDSPAEGDSADYKAHVVIADAAASLGAVESANANNSTQNAVAFAGSRKVLVECVAALLARTGGDQLIGALCNDVFKELHATLTDLAQSDRAKEFFASHADVFEVYGPLTQKRVRLVPNCDPTLIAAGERYLATHVASLEHNNSNNNGTSATSPPPGTATSSSTSPPIGTSSGASAQTSSAGAWSQFAKRIKEQAAASANATPSAQAPTSTTAAAANSNVHSNNNNNSNNNSNNNNNNNNSNNAAADDAEHQQQQRNFLPFEQQPQTADEVALLNMFSPLDPARAAAVAAARSACRHRFATLSVLAASAVNGQPAVCLLDSVGGVQQTAQAMRGAVVAIHLWRRRQPLSVAAVPVHGETPEDTQLISLLSLCVMTFTNGDAFVVDFQAEAAGADRSVAVACAHLLRELVSDDQTTVLFSDAMRDATPLLSLRSATRARIIDVRHAWSFLAELRERSALPQSPLGTVQNVPSISVLLEHFVGLAAAQRYVARLTAASAAVAAAAPSAGHVAWHEVRPLGAPALAAAAAEADGIAGVLRGLERQAAQLFLGVVRTTTQGAVNSAINGGLASSGGISSGGSAAQSLALAPLVNLLLPVDGGATPSSSPPASTGAANVYGSWSTSASSSVAPIADPMATLKAQGSAPWGTSPPPQAPQLHPSWR